MKMPTLGPSSEPASEGSLIDAFLSYSRRNDDIANELMEIFTVEAVRVARDINDLRGGEVWRRRLRGLIEESQNVLFLISAESLSSKYCSWELDYAVSLNKRLIPVLVGPSVPDDLPDSLSVVHWIDARENRAAAVEQIIEALRTDQRWTELHTRLGQRAREWRGAGGSLLQGRELKQVDMSVKLYQGKRPFPTGEQTTFLAESRRTARQQHFMLSGIVAVLLAVFVIISIGWWLKQREATLVALKGQGDSALVEIESGERAKAVASLAYVARNSEELSLAEYAEVGEFWAMRYEPLDELVKKMKVGELLGWRGTYYLKASSETWCELPQQPFSFAMMEEGRQALVVDASGASLHALPSFEKLLFVPAEGRLIPGSIYPVEGGKRLLATGHYLHAGDEDQPTFEPTLLTIMGANPDGFVPSLPGEQDKPNSFMQRILGKSGTLAYYHLTGERFTVGVTREEPAGKRLLIEGREEGYDDNPPKLVKWEIDVGSGLTALSVTEIAKHSEFGQAQPLPTPDVYTFPSELKESTFWKMHKARGDLPQVLRQMDEPSDVWQKRFEGEVGAIAFGEWEHGDKGDWKQQMLQDAVAWGVHEGTDGFCYPWALVITGNTLGELKVAKVGADKRPQWCRGAGFGITESRQEYSANKRWMAVASQDGAEEPLRMLDVTKGELLPAPEWPSVLAYGMAFDADSKFFAALTPNQELFIYSLEGAAAPRLLSRSVVGAQRLVGVWLGQAADKRSQLPLQFAGDTIVGIDVHHRMFGVQASTGAMLWSRALPEAGTGTLDDELWGAARGPYVVLRSGTDFWLHHAKTGTLLTDTIDPVDLREDHEPAFVPDEDSFADARVLVSNKGEFCIITDDGVFSRSCPAEKLPAFGADIIEKLTGVSAKDGRTQLERLPLKF